MKGFQLNRISTSQIREFAEYLVKFVPYMIDYSIEDEIKKMEEQRQTKAFWIHDQDYRIVGVVKIRRDNTFYSFGLIDSLDSSQKKSILGIIERKINFWFPERRYYATIGEEYLDDVLDFGFKIEFARYKMQLDVNNASNLLDYSDLRLQKFNPAQFTEMTKMFIDAYEGTIDEKIGMFNRNIAYAAIQSVIEGAYGDFKPELSVICTNKEKKIISASLISLSRQNIPLIVIIGVSKDYQGQKIGRKMLSANIELCKQYGYYKMSLWVTKDNESALRLYESMGFKRINTIYSVFKY